MRQKLAQFMLGRNGNDRFNMFLLGVSAVLILLSMFIGGIAGKVLDVLVVADLGYMYFRMLSRNIYKRREENERYLKLRMKADSAFRIRKERWVQRKDYKFFKCPECKTALRVPRGHGKVKVVCRKCGNSFTGKT